MKKQFLLLNVLLIMCLTTAVSAQQDSSAVKAAIRKAALAYSHSIDSKNVDSLVKYSHPESMKLFGGETEFTEAMKAGMANSPDAGSNTTTCSDTILLYHPAASVTVGSVKVNVKLNNPQHSGFSTFSMYFMAFYVDEKKSWTLIPANEFNQKIL